MLCVCLCLYLVRVQDRDQHAARRAKTNAHRRWIYSDAQVDKLVRVNSAAPTLPLPVNAAALQSDIADTAANILRAPPPVCAVCDLLITSLPPLRAKNSAAVYQKSPADFKDDMRAVLAPAPALDPDLVKLYTVPSVRTDRTQHTASHALCFALSPAHRISFASASDWIALPLCCDVMCDVMV